LDTGAEADRPRCSRPPRWVSWNRRPWKPRAAIADRDGEFHASSAAAQPGGIRGAHPGVDAGAQRFCWQNWAKRTGSFTAAGKQGRRGAKFNVLTDEVNALRARLGGGRGAGCPYTPEERALFKQPAPQTGQSRRGEKNPSRNCRGAGPKLVAEAQHYFSARQFDKAEDDYQKILQRD